MGQRQDMCKASHTVYVYLGHWAVKATWALFYNVFLLTDSKSVDGAL
jgi:hypothetical protein